MVPSELDVEMLSLLKSINEHEDNLSNLEKEDLKQLVVCLAKCLQRSYALIYDRIYPALDGVVPMLQNYQDLLDELPTEEGDGMWYGAFRSSHHHRD